MLNFLVNSKALSGKRKSAFKKLETRLKESGAEYRLFFSEKEGSIGKYARSLSLAGQRKFVAVGGDGTVNEMLSALNDPTVCEIGILPLGTGNDFAAGIHLPRGVKGLDAIINGRTQFVDYIEFGNGRRCLNIAGMGMDVDILKRREDVMKEGGKMSYLSSFFKSLKNYRGLDITTEVDGKETQYRAFIAAVCNGSRLGGGIKLCPDADPFDGKMQLLVVDYPKKGLLKEAFHLMRGKILKRPIAHLVSCTEARIRSKSEAFAQFDGEIFPVTEFYARLVSGKLKLYRG